MIHLPGPGTWEVWAPRGLAGLCVLEAGFNMVGGSILRGLAWLPIAGLYALQSTRGRQMTRIAQTAEQIGVLRQSLRTRAQFEESMLAARRAGYTLSGPEVASLARVAMFPADGPGATPVAQR